MIKNRNKLIGLATVGLVVIGGVVMVINTSIKNKQREEYKASNIETYERYVQIMQDGTKLNVSDKFLETKTYEGLEITNIVLKTEKGITTFSADITNRTRQTKSEQKISIILEDEKGNELGMLKGIIDKTSPNETVKLNVSVTKDMSNVYNFRVVGR